jgi:hypothetical protein
VRSDRERGGNVATVLADEDKAQDWTEPRPVAGPNIVTHAEAIWTFFGLMLLAAFLAFVSLQGA